MTHATAARLPQTLALQAMAVDFPHVHAHPNRLPFEGVLTLVDTPSDRAPSGARGHRVILTRAAAEAALPSLLGMAVDYKSPRPGDPATTGWDGHDARQKVGIITAGSTMPPCRGSTRVFRRQSSPTCPWPKNKATTDRHGCTRIKSKN